MIVSLENLWETLLSFLISTLSGLKSPWNVLPLLPFLSFGMLSPSPLFFLEEVLDKKTLYPLICLLCELQDCLPLFSIVLIMVIGRGLRPQENALFSPISFLQMILCSLLELMKIVVIMFYLILNNTFCEEFGQIINFDKSKLFISPNSPRRKAKRS